MHAERETLFEHALEVLWLRVHHGSTLAHYKFVSSREAKPELVKSIAAKLWMYEVPEDVYTRELRKQYAHLCTHGFFNDKP